MKILEFPDPILFKKCSEVSVFDDSLKEELRSMYDLMIASYGMGLAANQVGLDKKMFVMTNKGQPLFVINPSIVWKSRENASIKEGCLSAPNEFLLISNRSTIVKIEFQDENGTKRTKLFDDIESICVQHEIDHLDGKSFLESKTLPKETRRKLAQKWKIKK